MTVGPLAAKFVHFNGLPEAAPVPRPIAAVNNCLA
jgi:hypothetical protein